MALLLDWFHVSKPEPDTGVDAAAMWRADRPEARLNPDIQSITFLFQFKTTRRDRARSIWLTTEQVVRWTQLIHSLPIIVIRVQRASFDRQAYRVLVFHDWLLHHPKAAHEAHSRTGVSVPLSDFAVVNAEEDFQYLMVREAERILRMPGSLWRTRPTRSVPLAEGDLFRLMGRLSWVEPPDKLLTEVRDVAGPLIEDEWRFLRWHLWLPEPSREDPMRLHLLAEWRRQLEVSRSAELVHRQTMEFRRFVQSMRAAYFGEPAAISLPPYDWRAMGLWRACIPIFTESIRLLDAVFRAPCRWRANERAMALFLASALANSDEEKIASKARDLIGSWSDVEAYRVSDQSSYNVVRDYWVARAEAEGEAKLERHAIDFVYRHFVTDPTLPLDSAREYYLGLDDAAWLERLRARAVNPKRRETYTQQIHTAEFELFTARSPSTQKKEKGKGAKEKGPGSINSSDGRVAE